VLDFKSAPALARLLLFGCYGFDSRGLLRGAFMKTTQPALAVAVLAARWRRR
jgi:hypothetical protein